MSKKIIRAAVAGGMLMNMMGNGALVLAYSGETIYPENANTGITVTMVDARREQVSLYFEEPFNPMAVFRGVKLFNGEMHDNGLHAVNFTEAPWTTEYLATSMYDDEFEELENGEERTFATVGLATNEVATIGIAYLYWGNIETQSLYSIRARMNYSRCASSEIYQNTEEAICRAEKNEEGELYYQPYVGWERLNLPDEPEGERVISVYKDREWVNVTLNREEEDGENAGGGDAGDSEGGEGENGAEVVEPEIRYIEIEKIVEVPVERKVVEKVEVEVPVEKIVTEKVEVQVPIEKTVVDIREVVREVPVYLASEVVSSAGEMSDFDRTVEAEAELELEPESELELESESELKSEKVAEENASEDEIEPAADEDVELPELGKEVQKDDGSAAKVATLIAGVVVALSILVLAIAFGKKKRQESEVE